jgi:predicted HicB family RNase H-like nuclease
MNNILEYKGYHAKIQYNADTGTLVGVIDGINDFIDFECKKISALETEFHRAVDDYLDFCKEVGKEPEKEYKGSFNIRISPALHKGLALAALKSGLSINATVEKAIRLFLQEDERAPFPEASGRIQG